MKKITIRDVAKQAGVGVGTVSRVLNNSPQVSELTRRRVLTTIEQLGYKPNAVARQLPRKTRFKNIGVITRPFLNYYSFAERLRGVQRAIGQHEDSYEILLFHTRPTHDYHDRLMSIIHTGVIDGLLIIDLHLSEEQKEALKASGLPFVGLNHIQNADWACIGTDNQRGGYLATRYLLRNGHRSIGYLGDKFIDDEGFVTSGERYRGYKHALWEFGLDASDDLFCVGQHGYYEAVQLTHQLLTQAPHLTAIFAMSDTQALGAIAAVRESGRRVPEDVSVIGYDDLELSYHTRLTTVRQHLELSGEMGMAYLLECIQQKDPPAPPQLPDLQVVERATVRGLHD